MKNKKGFTIVELVVVIGVIGILSAILIPTFVSLNQKAENAKLQSNLHNAYSTYALDAADGKVGEDGAARGTAPASESSDKSHHRFFLQLPSFPALRVFHTDSIPAFRFLRRKQRCS